MPETVKKTDTDTPQKPAARGRARRKSKRQDPVYTGAPADAESLERALRRMYLPAAVRRMVDSDLARIKGDAEMDPSDLSMLLNYLSLIRDMPWLAKAPRTPSFKKAKAILDANHFGLDRVKARVIEQIAVMQLNGKNRGPILLLSGPPGVGKTSLARAMAEALGRPFARVALGGVSEETEIRGYRRTYQSAMPGQIIQAIRRTKSQYPVILLDEIDKAGKDKEKGKGGAVTSALLELLDPEQNRSFYDNYLNLAFDISNVFFVATANNIEDIPEPLMDRMETIWLSAYTDEEKVQISKKYLLPDVRSEVGLTSLQFSLSDEMILYIVRNYTRESGVRQLRRELTSVARKVARGVVENTKRPKNFKITPRDLTQWLGKARFFDEPNDSSLPAGVTVGLAQTEHGGDIMYVETSKSPARSGQGRLHLTGSLGDVMKESAQTVLSYLLANGDRLGLDTEEIEKSNIHIHLPDGGTPKDGPSAGLAIFSALVSLFMGKAVPAEIAMTGEVSLRGQALSIGALREKAIAAVRYGKTKILIPAGNRADIDEIPAAVRQKLTIVAVSSMDEVLKHCGLVREKKSNQSPSVTKSPSYP